MKLESLNCKIDNVLSHTGRLKYLPRDMFLPNIDQFMDADKDFYTIYTFLSESIRAEIKIIEEMSKNPMEGSFQKAKLIKEDIKRNHKDLISWLKSLPLYHEEQKQIFVHAGIDEEAGYWWQHGTSEDIFVSKYPASLGFFYKDIIAGHIGTYELKNQEDFYGVFWDGESHYYIDGTVEKSGKIPLLIYDTVKEKYIY